MGSPARIAPLTFRKRWKPCPPSLMCAWPSRKALWSSTRMHLMTNCCAPCVQRVIIEGKSLKAQHHWMAAIQARHQLTE